MTRQRQHTRDLASIVSLDNIPHWLRQPMLDAADDIYTAARKAVLEHESFLSLEEWCSEHRTLPQDAAESGRMSLERTPYLKGIAAALDSNDPSEQIVVVQKGSQLGFSELAVSWVGKIIHQDPKSVMFLQETEQKVKRTMRSRVMPMLRTPVFRGIVDPRAIAQQDCPYPGGTLTAWGSNSPSSFSSTTAAVIILDEFARYPTDVGGEGDPLTLIEARIATFGTRGKIYIPSTPVDDDGSEGGFATIYAMGDAREYFVPCPGCGEMDYFRRERFVASERGGRVQGRMLCDSCGEISDEVTYKRGLDAGEWRATKDAESNNVISYNCPGLLSPLGWMSWDSIAQKYLNAKKGRVSMRPVYNTCFGEPYFEEVETPKGDLQSMWGEERERGVVPDDVAYLTMGVDLQRGWMKWEVKGWKALECSASIDQGRIKHDISTMEGKRALRALIQKQWPTLRGGSLPVEVCAIDSGDGNTTNDAYVFASHFPQPVSRRGGWVPVSPRTVVVTKGGSKLNPERIIDRVTPLKKRVGMGRDIRLWVLGTPMAKLQLYKALSYDPEATDSFGAVSYPKSYDKGWWKELVAEPLQPRMIRSAGKMVFVFGKPKGRNEALDLHVLNRAAAEIFGCSQMTAAALGQFRRKGDAKPQPTPKDKRSTPSKATTPNTAKASQPVRRRRKHREYLPH